MRFNEKNILVVLVVTPIIAILLIVGFLTASYLNLSDKHLIAEKQEIIEYVYLDKKNILKNELNKILGNIEFRLSKIEQKTKAEIKERVYNAYNIAKSIYKTNKNLKSIEEIKTIVAKTIKAQRYNGGRGYFDIYDTKGIAYAMPIQEQYEGMSIINFRDKFNHLPIKEAIKIAKSKGGEGFQRYEWVKPCEEHDQEYMKLIFIKYFKELDLVISSGEYIVDTENDLKQYILQRIKQERFGNNGYLFVLDNKGKVIFHPAKKGLIEKKVYNLKGEDGYLLVDNIVNIAKEKKEGFITYMPEDSLAKNNSQKLTFIKLFERWNWIIGAGVFLDDIKSLTAQREKKINVKNQENIIQILTISIIVLTVSIILSLLIANKINRFFIEYKDTIEKKNSYLKEINENLEIRIKEEVRKNREKDIKLFENSKFIQIAEMIENISHHWRQPLSLISSLSSSIKLGLEFNTMNNKDIIKTSDEITEHTQNLSNTIDTFRDILKENKNVVDFNLTKQLDKVISLTQSALDENNITLKLNYKYSSDVTLTSIPSDLSQVVINIINNAKDAIKSNDIEHPFIKIDTQNNNKEVKIIIEDNGGGIPEDIISKIFNPYFSTKHKYQGTGLGLFVAQNLVIKNLGGTIEAANTQSGAKFLISVPKQNRRDR